MPSGTSEDRVVDDATGNRFVREPSFPIEILDVEEVNKSKSVDRGFAQFQLLIRLGSSNPVGFVVVSRRS